LRRLEELSDCWVCFRFFSQPRGVFVEETPGKTDWGKGIVYLRKKGRHGERERGRGR